MSDLILAFAVLIMFAAVYVMIGGLYIRRAQNRTIAADRESRCVRISAEQPQLAEAVAGTIEYCSALYPYPAFRVDSGRSGKLLRRLQDGSTDVLILNPGNIYRLGETEKYFVIPAKFTDTVRFSTERKGKLKNLSSVCLVWDSRRSLPDRDRFLQAVMNRMQPEESSESADCASDSFYQKYKVSAIERYKGKSHKRALKMHS